MNNVLTAADTLVFINGKGYGLAVGADIQISSPVIPSQTIDAHLAHEFLPQQQISSLSFSVYRAITQGDWETYRLAALPNQLPIDRPIAVKLINRRTQQVLWDFENAIVIRQAWSVAAQKLMQGQISLVSRASSNDFADSTFQTTNVHYGSDRFGSNILR